ncbi:hypothetical protein [Qipengyuania marisflavi]|uniref:Uncharacterized protein n=1 Tax=Qipengyuania marisflavi TaxID=2486356 RepID=A0A5S3PCR0_9SPHN|nr:hypothetical protein [Qipengyuania marisflavi]TMM49039.1 hypothetical protein FEV51_06625 [Qipengyuania marisflavi]
MTALLITALLTVTGMAALSVLADNGLRWWSAFGQLRAELAAGQPRGGERKMRPATPHCSARMAGRSLRAGLATRRSARRAAA